MSKEIDHSKRYWWLTLVVVPILAAVIGQTSGLLDFFKPPTPTPPPPPVGVRVTNNMYFITQVFDTQVGQKIIDQAAALAKAGRYTEALAMLKVVAAQYPSPAINNDLGVLYAGAGDNQNAQAALQKALKAEDNNQAVNLNLGYLAQAQGNTDEAVKYFSKAPDLYSAPTPEAAAPATQTVNTQTPGVTATLLAFSRFQNTVTINLRLDNSSAKEVRYCGELPAGYVLDEATGKKYGRSSDGISQCATIVAANSSLKFWVKYSLPAGDNPQYLTAALGYGIVFEHLTPASAVPTTTVAGITVNTQTPGVTATLLAFSRFQNTVTINLRLDNSSAKEVRYCGELPAGYVLDEATGKKYGRSSDGISQCATIVAANSSLKFWVKYSLPAGDNPQYLTAALGYGILFEHLTPKSE